MSIDASPSRLARQGGGAYHGLMQREFVNPTSEHAIFLKLFVTNGGGW
jgi:hypothetical protein